MSVDQAAVAEEDQYAWSRSASFSFSIAGEASQLRKAPPVASGFFGSSTALGGRIDDAP
jgi:hypothetical protein